MDTLAGMRFFVQVVRAGNFSAAGRQLDLAPSSISRQINSLEDELDVRLFHRSTRKLHLTEAGELYYDYASRILAEVDEANRAVTDLEATPRGTLRINSPVVFGRVHVAPAILAFLERYPEIQIHFDTTDQVVDLIEDGVDVAVRIGELKDSSLIARRLAPMRRVICGSPAYLKRHGVPQHPEELAQHDCLTFRFHVASNLWRPGANLWRLKGSEGVTEVAVSGRLQANSADALTTAACAGLGLVLVPGWLVGEHIRQGRLQVVLGDYQVSPTSIDPDAYAIWAVYPSKRHLSPKVRAFVDFLAARFQDQF